MSVEAIEEFGQRLVHHVRDSAMPQCDLVLDIVGRRVKRSRIVADVDERRLLADMLIPDCVDRTVFYVLHAIDHDIDLHVSYTTNGGETVDMSAVGGGEPIGWYAGTPGWRTWYSKERIDDRNNLGVKDDTDDPAPNQDELPMPRRAIEELGELLVRHVRDVAIQSCDMQLLPHSNTPMAKRWRRAALPFNGKVPPRVLIPDCVDEALFAFLRAIDKGLLRLSFTAENGETVDLVKAGRGELAARYMASDGWRAKYSKERFFDDNREWTAEELAAIAEVVPEWYGYTRISDIGRKLTDADIGLFEKMLRARLPETYRHYLLTFNGGVPSPNVLEFGGPPHKIELKVLFSLAISDESRDIVRRWQSVPGCKDNKWLPIGCDMRDACLALDLNQENYGRVYFIDPKANPPQVYLVAQDFGAMMDALRRADPAEESS